MHKIFSHRRESHKIVIKGPAVAGKDLTRSWYKNLSRASQKSFRRSTSNTWHLQDLLHARTSWRGPYQDLNKIFCQGAVQDRARTCKKGLHQDLHKIFSGGPVQDHARTSWDRLGDRSRIFSRSSHKDLYKIMQGPQKTSRAR